MNESMPYIHFDVEVIPSGTPVTQSRKAMAMARIVIRERSSPLYVPVYPYVAPASPVAIMQFLLAPARQGRRLARILPIHP